MKRLSIFFFILWAINLNAQSNPADSTKKDTTIKRDRFVVSIGYEIENNDTLQVYLLNNYIRTKEKVSDEEKEKYKKLVRYVTKVLPYAKLAAFRLQMMEDNLNLLTSDRAKKKYIKACEKSIKNQFIDDLKNFYVEEGRILLKLIHRETGKTTWDIMKNYSGSLETFFWQTIAKTYDASMKATYDPVLDYQIEEIIKSLEQNAAKN